jgi:hypothetical protein
MSSWISAAEAAVDGRPQGASDVEVDVFERTAPPVFDTAGVRALAAPLFAGFVWGATLLRETLAGHPLDALALLLRLLALALTVRAVLALRMLTQRLRVRFARARYALALTDEGLFYRSPSGDVVVPRHDVLEAREHGDWQGRSGRRWADVYLITRPESGRTHLTLPPVFLDTSGVVAERLMRWLAQHTADGAATRQVERPSANEETLPSKLWERLVAGEQPAGVTVFRNGNAWLRRGPYASLLLGLAVLDGYRRLPAAARAAIGSKGPLGLLMMLGVVPVLWLLYTRAQLAPGGGIALVLTPTEALMRTRAGVHRVAWGSVTRSSVETRTVWTVTSGAHKERTLVLHRESNDDVRYPEAFLGAPLEVVLAFC